MAGPLTGVKVLDLSRVLAGPYCTMTLGDAGADVIKIEPPGGDETRRWGPPFLEGEAAYYLSCNRNKRSMVVDLAQNEGQRVLRRMASKADVLIENFKLGTMERWGLGYEEVLRPENPRLVYCNISGFGRTGPYADLPGYDFVVQAMGGLMSITGEVGGVPQKVGVAIADLTTGMMAAFGITAALHHRAVVGTGQRVDLSLLETQVSWLANMASNYLMSGKVPSPIGNAHANVVPYQTLAAQDRELVVAVGTDPQFRRFCQSIGLPELGTDPLFATNSARITHRSKLLAILEPVFLTRTADEWLKLLWESGIPSGPINTLDRVFADPQVRHRQMLQEVPHPTIGSLPQVGLPIKFGDTPGAITRHPPLLGEHATQILSESGYGPDEIAALLESGVVSPGPQAVPSKKKE